LPVTKKIEITIYILEIFGGKETFEEKMSFTIGSSVMWNEVESEGKGMWSGVVKDIETNFGVETARIYCDGIIVPTMMRCGIQGPNSWTYEVWRPLTQLKLRPEGPDDDTLRAAWESRKAAYYGAEEAVKTAQAAALKARYSFVEPGLRVGHAGAAAAPGYGDYTGTVVSVNWDHMTVLVEGCWTDKPMEQTGWAIDTLVYT